MARWVCGEREWLGGYCTRLATAKSQEIEVCFPPHPFCRAVSFSDYMFGCCPFTHLLLQHLQCKVVFILPLCSLATWAQTCCTVSAMKTLTVALTLTAIFLCFFEYSHRNKWVYKMDGWIECSHLF